MTVRHFVDGQETEENGDQAKRPELFAQAVLIAAGTPEEDNLVRSVPFNAEYAGKDPADWVRRFDAGLPIHHYCYRQVNNTEGKEYDHKFQQLTLRLVREMLYGQPSSDGLITLKLPSGKHQAMSRAALRLASSIVHRGTQMTFFDRRCELTRVNVVRTAVSG